MNKVIDCPCGQVIQGASEDEVVAKAQEHAQRDHGMELTREQAQAMAHPE